MTDQGRVWRPPAGRRHRGWGGVVKGAVFAAAALLPLMLVGRVFFGATVDHQSSAAIIHDKPASKASETHAAAPPTATVLEPVPTAVVVSEVESRPSATAAAFLRDSGEYVLDPTWDTGAAPTTRHYNWTISEIQGDPDGSGVWRTLIVVNGQFPGPMVECNEGDTILVDVFNGGTNSTSIHWHGQHQNGTIWMDGTAGVTNCPIPPGESFQYEFTVRNQWGTYWYHAHFSTTRIDGLFGPFVVHSPHEAQPEYSSDRVVMLHDYYRTLSSELLPIYLASDNENAEPVPDGALVNGRPLERLQLASEAKHRLRFINVGAFAEFDVSVDGHELTLFEVDGEAVQLYRLHRFKINVAQRYSFVLHTNQTADGDAFWLRARMIVHCFAEIPKDLQPEVKAIVQYSGAAKDVTPTTSGWGEPMELFCKDLDTSELVPVPAIAAPPADLMVHLRSNFEIGAYRLSRGFFNKTSWRPARHSPTLLEAVDGLSTGNASFDKMDDGLMLTEAYDTKRQLVVRIDGIKTVDLLVENFDDGNHPLHLHGTRVWVLAQGHGYPNMTELAGLNVSNPLRRDTVSIEAFGWILIRFIADNPGMWAFHCHLAWHVEAGMLMQFLIRPEMVKDWKVPDTVSRMCAMREKQRGGGIEDEWFYHD